MLRKFLTSLFMVVVVGAALPAKAGESFLDDLEQFRAQVLEDRREVVRVNLELTSNEATAFWPTYESYQEEIDDFRRRRLHMVLDFLENRGVYDRAECVELLRDWLLMKTEWAELERAWLGEFLSVLPAPKVLRYYQIENKIDALINAELASFIPLAGTGVGS